MPGPIIVPVHGLSGSPAANAEAAYTLSHTVQHSPQSAAEAQATLQNTGDYNKIAGSALPPAMTPTQVRSLQQWLVNRGYNIAQDGILGPQTKSAAQAFRADHKSGAAWSAKNGIGVHPGTVTPHDTTGATPPVATGHSRGSNSGTAGGYGRSAFTTLLGTLLKQGGSVGTPLDPTSFGNAAAAPDDALAATLARQAAQNPRDEAQHQADISSWYGLDPTDPNYKLSVLGRLAQARGLDAKSAADTSSNVSSIAQQLASSIGGSANDGSGEVAAAGANAAGTASALGEADKQYADQMNPLLAAEARGASSKDKATMQQTLLDILDKRAEAEGQAKADRANGAAAALDRNNALDQQKFANRGNLLSTLAQVASVDPNANYLKDKKLEAQIWSIDNPGAVSAARRGGSGMTQSQTTGMEHQIVQNIVSGLGLSVGSDASGNSTPIAPTNAHGAIAKRIGAYLRSAGIKPGTSQFKVMGDAMFGVFVDQHGRPLAAPPNWGI